MKLTFFGGKGGVGKTTCAAAYAVEQSRRSAGNILLVSTDPAHSLGDVLGKPLASKPRAVRRRLHAAELDAPRAFTRWLAANRRALADVLERGTWLDRADVNAILDLAMPGVDELVGLIEIQSLAARGYGRVIVDTAPTGHTLRLLSAPDTVAAVAGVLDALQEDHRIVRRQFARVLRDDAADRFITLLARQAEAMAAMLRDPRRTTFRWVTLAEPMAIAESEDGIAALDRAGITVDEIIVNRVLPAGPKCPTCDPRRGSERKALAQIRQGIGRERRVRLVPENTKGIKGTKDTKASRAKRETSPAAGEAVPADVIDRVRGSRLIFVGGKGGVGKTTVSAAIALRIARANAGTSVLLLSTDPAHSVADVLETPLGDDERTVRGGPANLVARELDAARALAARRQALEAALDGVEESLSAGAAQAKPLMDLAPPGVDELFGMLSLLEARGAHRVIVVDTAPTGHALRLLEMPDLAREWVQTLLRVLLKYRAIVRPGKLGAELVDASQAIRTLQEMLHDRAQTCFLVVTRAEAEPRAETGRLVRRLRALGLHVPAMIVNARTLAPGTCPHCRAVARAEGREMATLARLARGARLRDCAIIQAPIAAPPPRGTAALDRWAVEWISGGPGPPDS